MREIVCTHCGSHDLEYKDGILICRSCDAKFIPDQDEKALAEMETYGDGLNRKAKKLLDKILHPGNGKVLDQKQALDISYRALEEAPASSLANWIHMQVLEANLFSRDDKPMHAEWICDAGRDAVRYAEQLSLEEFHEMQHDVNELLLEGALHLMDDAARWMEETEDLEKSRDFYLKLVWHAEGETLEGYLEQQDAIHRHFDQGKYEAARILVHEADDAIIRKYPELISHLVRYRDDIMREMNGSIRRFHFYRKEMPESDRIDRENEIRETTDRIERLKT